MAWPTTLVLRFFVDLVDSGKEVKESGCNKLLNPLKKQRAVMTVLFIITLSLFGKVRVVERNMRRRAVSQCKVGTLSQATNLFTSSELLSLLCSAHRTRWKTVVVVVVAVVVVLVKSVRLNKQYCFCSKQASVACRRRHERRAFVLSFVCSVAFVFFLSHGARTWSRQRLGRNCRRSRTTGV